MKKKSGYSFLKLGDFPSEVVEYPKCPPSAFIIFLKSSLEKEGLKWNPTIFKDFSQTWKSLNDEKKGIYYEKYAESLEKYRKDVKMLNLTLTPEMKISMIEKRISELLRKKSRNKENIYATFVKNNYAEMMKKHPELKGPQLLKKIGEKWQREKKPLP